MATISLSPQATAGNPARARKRAGARTIDRVHARRQVRELREQSRTAAIRGATGYSGPAVTARAARPSGASQRWIAAESRQAKPALTRGKARVVAALGAIGLGAAVFVLMPTTAEAGPEPQTVIVEPGDGLWRIAERTMPGSDPREAVSKLAAVNHIKNGVVVPGQRLVIPT